MSFSSDLKEELSKVSTKNKDCCKKAELFGFLITCCKVVKTKNGFALKVLTESEASIKRLYHSFRVVYGITPTTNIEKKLEGKDILLELMITNKDDLQKIFMDQAINMDVKLQIVLKEGHTIKENECCMRSFLRGAFMGSGCIIDPNTSNHLEIVLENEQNANFINCILNELNINAKIMKRKKSVVLYLKDAEAIFNLLILIGSSKCAITYEEIKTMKNYNNYRNRKDNCETANWDKTAMAASMQNKDIVDIKKAKQYEKMPEKLRQVANLRVKYPMASLEEIGNMLEPKLSKAGVSHRFKKINEFAEEIRKKV